MGYPIQILHRANETSNCGESQVGANGNVFIYNTVRHWRSYILKKGKQAHSSLKTIRETHLIYRPASPLPYCTCRWGSLYIVPIYSIPSELCLTVMWNKLAFMAILMGQYGSFILAS